MRGERESEPNPFSLTNGRQRQFSSPFSSSRAAPQDTTINRHTHFISVSEGEGGGRFGVTWERGTVKIYRPHLFFVRIRDLHF